jgi:hypothetical protein
VERLEAPAVGEEALGEVVEEFRMGGAFAVVAEVGGGGDEAAAEVVVPEAVDDDAGGEGVTIVGEPAGELEAGFAFGGVEGEGEVGVGERGEAGGGDGFAALHDAATFEEIDGFGGRLEEAGVGEGEGRDLLALGFGGLELGFGGGEGGAVGGVEGFEGDEAIEVGLAVGETVVVGGDGGPGLAVEGEFDLVLGDGVLLEAPLEGAEAIGGPGEFLDEGRGGQGEGDGGGGRWRGGTSVCRRRRR